MKNPKRKVHPVEKIKQKAKKQTNLIKSNINLSYLTFGNLTPIIASSGFDRKQFVISFVTSLFNRLFPFVSKWHAICWDTSTRILSGSGIIDHGLNAEPLSKIARWIKPGNGFYNSFLFLFCKVIGTNQIIFYFKFLFDGICNENKSRCYERISMMRNMNSISLQHEPKTFSVEFILIENNFGFLSNNWTN